MPSLCRRATEAQEGHGAMAMLALGFRSQLTLVVRDVSWIPGWEEPWRRAWQPTLVFLPREPHGQRNLVGYGP